ncbi:MAG: hypothetical protein MJZ22_05505, partial [Candidatus Saccharibacteria bacterium]|nr:hypothetical protein [Candidatus Saccharibacteria bacterium]
MLAKVESVSDSIGGKVVLYQLSYFRNFSSHRFLNQRLDFCDCVAKVLLFLYFASVLRNIFLFFVIFLFK